MKYRCYFQVDLELVSCYYFICNSTCRKLRLNKSGNVFRKSIMYNEMTFYDLTLH